MMRQAMAQLRSQKMLTVVGITGTALSIFLIMVVVMLQQVKVAPYAPVSNRPRMMFAKYASIFIEDTPYQSNGPMSYKSAKELYGNLETAERTTIFASYLTQATMKVTGGLPIGTDMLATDGEFWNVYDFTFLAGKPYDQTAVEAEQRVAVIDESTARRLFGSTDVAGREFQLNHSPYTVAGVVRDVSSLAEECFAHVWVPLTTTPLVNDTWNSYLMGSFSAAVLAKSSDDFDAIREECDRRMTAYNKAVKETSWQFISRGRPYTKEESLVAQWANIEPDLKTYRRDRLIVFLILLIVPAINLSGMTESRMRQRREEIGVRRAFGCKRSTLLMQLFGENLLITVVAGLIGWALSIGFAYLFSTMLFLEGYSNTLTMPKVSLEMLVQPSTFAWALGFCFVLNLLSTGVPAWKASRTNIVNAINKK